MNMLTVIQFIIHSLKGNGNSTPTNDGYPKPTFMVIFEVAKKALVADLDSEKKKRERTLKKGLPVISFIIRTDFIRHVQCLIAFLLISSIPAESFDGFLEAIHRFDNMDRLQQSLVHFSARTSTAATSEEPEAAAVRVHQLRVRLR